MSTTPPLPLPNRPFTRSQNSSGTFKFPAPISNSTPKKWTAKQLSSKPTNTNTSKDDDQVLPETLDTYFGESKYIGGSELDSDETKQYKEQKKNEIIASNQKKIEMQDPVVTRHFKLQYKMDLTLQTHCKKKKKTKRWLLVKRGVTF